MMISHGRRLRTITMIAAAYFAMGLHAVCRAQTAVDEGPRFEVATVKPSRPDANSSTLNIGVGRITVENMSLFTIIKFAYGVNIGANDQIEGAPNWIRQTHFDITAKEEGRTAAKMETLTIEDRMRTMRTMMQALLAERFSLKVHREAKERAVNALVVAKGGPKLQQNPGCPLEKNERCKTDSWLGLHSDGRGHMESRGSTTMDLADSLAGQSDIGGKTVVDQTGLTGRYNFTLTWTPESKGGDDPGPSLFTALQEQLGLKLEVRKLPVDVLVVDQVEQPTEN